MSLQFYFGPSGSGKSRKLHMDMLALAEREPEKTILFLVPDQFTLQTQADLVNASERKGIMNIDVLSFGRLAHRIFEETGFGGGTVLDDTGKSLVLRKVAASLEKDLPVLGPNLHKIGYIHEVKSAISEFMQYGITPAQVDELSAYARERGVLSSKLKDLQKLYEGFRSYIARKFITTEETLELLTRAVGQSEIIRDSVMVFDGFTGFTPIQNRLIQRLMELTDRVIISITIDTNSSPFHREGEQELFYLSRKTVADLCGLAKESAVERAEDVYLNGDRLPRFGNNPMLAHLERHLFRYPVTPYEGDKDGWKAPEALELMELPTPAAEARQICIRIKELVLSGRYSYRDIAVVAGDLETCADYLEREGKKYDIPMFLDRTRGLLLNPFIEFIRSSLRICLRNFSYDAVFHYLRSGLTDFTTDEIDRLENYVLALGIKGKRKWSEAFTRRPPFAKEGEQAEVLAGLNRTRERMMEQLAPLMQKQITAGEYIRTLYEFIVSARVQEKLAGFEAAFRSRGNLEKAREYAQIYRLVMELLEQMEALLSGEQMSLQEFADILDAGFGEIEIGIIPGGVDRVVVGDVERTRLKQVKVLFFLGVNDGNIPKGSTQGGILSDIDREFLKDSGYELAPTPRQQMYIQRLYLYMNLTKPSERLYLSYTRVNSEGKALRPSYLMDLIRRLFPGLTVERPDSEENIFSQITGPKDGISVLAKELLALAEGRGGEEREGQTAALLKLYREQEGYGEILDRLLEAAFTHYQHRPLSREVARAVYGAVMENSVSRLEQYAACAYAHFLRYGMMLSEREEYGFEQVDLGNIYHTVLERFSALLSQNQYTWFDFPDEEGERLLEEALRSCTVEYRETVLYSSARYEYMIQRMYRILKRTVLTLKEQLKKGSFVPSHFEMSFSRVEELASLDLTLTGEEKMKLKGRIDRIDTLEDEGHVYVKVVDYKSGNQKFDLAAVYYGLQLQLVIYMDAASEMEKRRHPGKEVIPAALLYYHVSDPMIREEKELSSQELNQRLLRELRMSGLVSDRQEVLAGLDGSLGASRADKSLVIPVERKKDGGFTASSGVVSGEDYQVLSRYVGQKIKDFGREILRGDIALNPCEQGTENACTYCQYQGVCGFDEKIPGYEKRLLPPLTGEEALALMKQEKEAGD